MYTFIMVGRSGGYFNMEVGDIKNMPIKKVHVDRSLIMVI